MIAGTAARFIGRHAPAARAPSEVGPTGANLSDHAAQADRTTGGGLLNSAAANQPNVYNDRKTSLSLVEKSGDTFTVLMPMASTA